MTAPITRHQRELCNLAIVVAQQQDTIDGLQRYLKRLHDAKEELVRREELLTEERDALLEENGKLRADIDSADNARDQLSHEVDRLRVELKTALGVADHAERSWAHETSDLQRDIDGLESVIHELVEDRWWKRYHSRIAAKTSYLYQKQSLEFCRNYEREEKRANSAESDLKACQEFNRRLVNESALERTEIKKLRRAIKSMLAAASTRDLRRKLQAIAEGVMKS